jgi:hypothetical protein
MVSLLNDRVNESGEQYQKKVCRPKEKVGGTRIIFPPKINRKNPVRRLRASARPVDGKGGPPFCLRRLDGTALPKSRRGAVEEQAIKDKGTGKNMKAQGISRE